MIQPRCPPDGTRGAGRLGRFHGHSYNPRGLAAIDGHFWSDERGLIVKQEDSATPTQRIGIGHDTHRLAPGGPLRLGGVMVPFDRHLVGHSDADVLLHAVTDALLGAAALPDIGELFPDTDEANRGRDSAEMLARAVQLVAEAGYRVANVDCIVFAEQPKLSLHKEAIRRGLAELLQVEIGQVGLKSKTGEKVGPVGRQEAIEAQAVVLIELEVRRTR